MFLEETDFEEAIKEEILDAVIDGSDNALEEADRNAVGVAAGYLNGLYDTHAIFTATGADRNSTLVAIVLDIALYRLHKRINPRQIPEIRRIAYEDAIALLKSINKRENIPVGLPPVVDGSGNTESISRFGSNDKMNHRW
jgi:phage gp36-like protein